MNVWWRVSCAELGDGATESVLAPTAELAAKAWAEGREMDSVWVRIVEVVEQAGGTGVAVGIPARLLVWRSRRLGWPLPNTV